MKSDKDSREQFKRRREKDGAEGEKTPLIEVKKTTSNKYAREGSKY